MPGSIPHNGSERDGDAPTVICWGEFLWDLYPDTRRMGGAPANVAVHLAALGRPVALLTRVGDDELGHAAIAALAGRGVDTSLVQVDGERPTGRVGIAIEAGEPRYRLYPDCAWERIAAEPAASALTRAEMFYFGTLSQIRDVGQFQRALAALPADCLKVCDLNLRRRCEVDAEAVRAAVRAADVVKLNDGEAEALARRFEVSDAVAWMLDQH
ncbi:MAG: PfkB family carbohydrate kinase, partial [Myxococcota bacterium]